MDWLIGVAVVLFCLLLLFLAARGTLFSPTFPKIEAPESWRLVVGTGTMRVYLTIRDPWKIRIQQQDGGQLEMDYKNADQLYFILSQILGQLPDPMTGPKPPNIPW